MERRLEVLSRCFAAEVAAYAALSNHLHVVVRLDPSRTREWSDMEVARRWHTIFPRRYARDGTPLAADPERIAAAARSPAWVAERRRRLGDLSWFMRCLNEHIARRANREDGCTGRFWEGRFQSIPLLDQRALMACMVYVDLNPIRAGEAETPETAAFTGVKCRIDHVCSRAGQAQTAVDAMQDGHLSAPASADGAGCWLAPLSACVSRWAEDVPETTPMDLAGYLRLVDATGRLLRAGAGSIPADLADILTRLELDPERWERTMRGWRQMSGGAVGSADARCAEARRRGTNWVKSTCALFAAT